MEVSQLVRWIDGLIDQDALWKFYKSKEFVKLKNNILKKQHYECQICREQGIITRADTVHHVQYVRSHPELALSEFFYANGKRCRNLIAVCKSCHNKLHREKGYHRSRTIKVVTGLPGAGKTTWVAQRREDDEPVFDLDYITKALALGGKAEGIHAIGNGLLKEYISQCRNRSAWVIRMAPQGDELRHMISAGCVFIDLDTPAEICQERRGLTDDQIQPLILRHTLYLQELHDIMDYRAGNADDQERW